MIEGIILIVVSIVVTLIALKLLLSMKSISRKGIEAEGIVFDIEQSVGTDNNVNYPIIRFLTTKNYWITKSSKTGVIPGLYKKGAKVKVIYQNDNPDNFFIKSKFTYFIPIVMIAIAIILTGVGVFRLANI